METKFDNFLIFNTRSGLNYQELIIIAFDDFEKGITNKRVKGENTIENSQTEGAIHHKRFCLLD